MTTDNGHGTINYDDENQALPCIKVWRPRFNEIGEARSEVSKRYDSVGSDHLMSTLKKHDQHSLT